MEQKIIDKLENLQFDITITKDLTRILGEHFDCKRYKERFIDHVSLTYMFDEYKSLSYDLSRKLVSIERNIKDIIDEIYKEK